MNRNPLLAIWHPLSLLCILILVLLLATPAAAQESTDRDPLSLAMRLLGYDGSPAIPEPVPAYKAGDTAAFYVSRVGQDYPVQITAALAASTSGLYVWVEQGIDFDPAALSEMAGQLDRLFTLLQIAENRGGVQLEPQSADELEFITRLRLPDVDNDPHINILFTRELRDNRAVLFNPNDSLPSALVPGGFSNQRELIQINTSALPGVALGDPTYIGILVRQFFNMLAFYNTPGQAPWLREALSWFTLLDLQGRELQAEDVAAFFTNPSTPLTALPGLASAGQELGAGQLFLRYFTQRFGETAFRQVFAEAGPGLDAFNRVLQRGAYLDPATGQPIRAADVFADFVMTNSINLPIGDGRFVYTGLPAARGTSAAAAVIQDRFNFDLQDLSVPQLGTAYLALTTSTGPVDFTLNFVGQDRAPRQPIPGDPTNHFYWSGSGLVQDTTLTRAFDLSGVSSATLTFDVWHSLIEHWNYAYVLVSADGGRTWQLLPSTSTVASNPYALSYGPAFTGVSNPQGARPFPYLGVGLEADGLTISRVLEDGPLAGSPVQVGDVIAGVDGKPWSRPTNLIAFLADYRPGDSLTLYVQRGDTYLDVPVTLGRHPTRMVQPDPIWVPQQVDLSAYAGRSILLRFECVSVAEAADRGIALDNIAIPELNFADDAEAGVQGWTLNGWQQMTNLLSQRFLVQSALLSPDDGTGSVRRLIGPDDRAVAGSWDFTLAPRQLFLVAISGLNEDTTALARFGIFVRSEVPATPQPTATPV